MFLIVHLGRTIVGDITKVLHGVAQLHVKLIVEPLGIFTIRSDTKRLYFKLAFSTLRGRQFEKSEEL